MRNCELSIYFGFCSINFWNTTLKTLGYYFLRNLSNIIWLCRNSKNFRRKPCLKNTIVSKDVNSLVCNFSHQFRASNVQFDNSLMFKKRLADIFGLKNAKFKNYSKNPLMMALIWNIFFWQSRVFRFSQRNGEFSIYFGFRSINFWIPLLANSGMLEKFTDKYLKMVATN